MPTFYSTVSSFTVIFKNVNYTANQTESNVFDGGLKRGLNEMMQNIIVIAHTGHIQKSRTLVKFWIFL
jgi:hypothetical protein